MSIDAPIDRDCPREHGAPTGYNSFHFSPKGFAHFFAWWGCVILHPCSSHTTLRPDTRFSFTDYLAATWVYRFDKGRCSPTPRHHPRSLVRVWQRSRCVPACCRPDQGRRSRSACSNSTALRLLRSTSATSTPTTAKRTGKRVRPHFLPRLPSLPRSSH